MSDVSSYDPDAPTPKVGSRWIWAPKIPKSWERITVVEVKWNGEEWWVRSEGPRGLFWNDVSLFWESVAPDTGQRRPVAPIDLPPSLDPQGLATRPLRDA